MKSLNKEKKIILHSRINEIFAITELTQFFKNPYKTKNLELVINFPILENINISKFEISTSDKTIKSKILEKEKAKEKYSDSIAEGNKGIFLEYSNNYKSYMINIGNINPNELLCLKTIYNQQITSFDMSYRYIIMNNFPSFSYNLSNKKCTYFSQEIEYNINITTFSEITRLYTNFNEKKKFEIEYNKNYTVAKLINKIKRDKNNNDFKNELHILFRTKDINLPCLFHQYDPILQKHSYSLNYIYCDENILNSMEKMEKPDDNIISYKSKYQNDLIYIEPALFIFLIDQSGSMKGQPIELVKESLLIFMQSLPINSYFQIIGFGTNFKKYNSSPVIYSEENIIEIMEKIKKLEGDLGRTNILAPLEDIFKNIKEYENIQLNKHIFLLTDGRVEQRKKVIRIINKNSMFRIHGIGYGGKFDVKLIKSCINKKYGSTAHFVKNIKNINKEIMTILNESIRPCLYNININLMNIDKNNEKKDYIYLKNKSFIFQDEIINYSFILDEKEYLIDFNGDFKYDIQFYKSSELIKNELIFNKPMNLPDGDNLSKIIIDKYLKINSFDKEKEIELAKEYDVLSKNTALYAKMPNDNYLRSEMKNIIIKQKTQKKEIKNTLLFNLFKKKYRKKLKIERDKSTNNIDKRNNMKTFLAKKRESQFSKNSMERPKKFQISDENKNINLVSLIISQNPIEGFWNKNENTITVEKLYEKKIINNIKKICLNLKDKEKIFYTILIIYYISTKYEKNCQEYKLVLNKAKKYLSKNNIIYDKISYKIIQ